MKRPVDPTSAAYIAEAVRVGLIISQSPPSDNASSEESRAFDLSNARSPQDDRLGVSSLACSRFSTSLLIHAARYQLTYVNLQPIDLT